MNKQSRKASSPSQASPRDVWAVGREHIQPSNLERAHVPQASPCSAPQGLSSSAPWLLAKTCCQPLSSLHGFESKWGLTWRNKACSNSLAFYIDKPRSIITECLKAVFKMIKMSPTLKYGYLRGKDLEAKWKPCCYHSISLLLCEF